MLLTITTTHRPATDLGYLLVKHPDKCQSFDLSFGKAHVFYPEVSEERCMAALLLDLDPIGLVRGRYKDRSEGATLAQYVNDRPYVASSFLSVAISNVYASALGGRNKGKPELVDVAIPLEAAIYTVPCRGGEALLRRLFESLGYTVQADRVPLDEKFPEWGEGPYFKVHLAATKPLKDLLRHLYVLLPVLDNDKHYWVGEDEIENLLHKGEGWLGDHPERDQIVNRALKFRRPLAREAIARLVADDVADLNETDQERASEEQVLEERISLNDQRMGAVLAVLKETGAKRVIDLGCGEGRLLNALLKEKGFEHLAGMDVSVQALEYASSRLKLEHLPERVREKVELFQGGLTYRDSRITGYDTACAVEVIEHMDPSRVRAFERVVFEFGKPRTVIITTPNIEYNVRFEHLPAGRFRHRDHRFEWTRADFEKWASRVAKEFGYSVRFLPVGLEDRDVGPPTQMGVFSR